jgi:phenylalanyl-tRNA synthetase beta chain
MTLSAVDEAWTDAIRPWSAAEPLRTSTPVLRRADRPRQTLVPSLLAARRHNEKLSNPTIELFEIAKAYLPREGQLPEEMRLLAMTSGGGFFEVKGVVEALVGRLAPAVALAVEPCTLAMLEPTRAGSLTLNGKPFGFIGEVSPEGRGRFELRGATTVAEVNVDMLAAAAELVPLARPLSPYPPIGRDLNVVFDEAVRWADVERIVRSTGGEPLESVEYQDTYRNPERIGAGKKSVVFSLQLRSATGTLTNEEADAVRDRIVAALEKQLGGALRA